MVLWFKFSSHVCCLVYRKVIDFSALIFNLVILLDSLKACRSNFLKIPFHIRNRKLYHLQIGKVLFLYFQSISLYVFFNFIDFFKNQLSMSLIFTFICFPSFCLLWAHLVLFFSFLGELINLRLFLLLNVGITFLKFHLAFLKPKYQYVIFSFSLSAMYSLKYDFLFDLWIIYKYVVWFLTVWRFSCSFSVVDF